MDQTGLDIIANKPPVVATHIGGFAPEDQNNTFSRYETEALTYIRPPEIQAYQQKVISTVLERERATIACLVAPFGYGKTSTAIDLWKFCEEAGILAIPPFSCNSITEMGMAIATGLEVILGRVAPDAAAQVRDAYNAYLTSSAERLAQQDVARYNIEFDTALQSIEDKIAQGYLHIEASGTNLLAFLERLVEIVVAAGFKGLLVTVDEFQQFLGTINKAVITNLRTLVWGLRTRTGLPFGLVITMDPDTERNLSDRAGDILHRIKEDGLYLNFASVYDREFPRLLWTRYAHIFDFEEQSKQVVDRATLEAIGQICERSDLSSGPRTVINAFQRIVTTYTERQRAYSPLDLIDDFLTGDIKFDGDQNKIASLVTELTSYDFIKRVPSRVDTMKLFAAFPRGCPREVAEHYGLADIFDQLSDELRGEIVTELPEGTALIDLQRVGKPQNKLNIILKKYWLQITEEEIIAERIAPLFARYAIDPLFPPFTNILSGWRRLEGNSFRLTPQGSYLQIYEGTFFKEYPARRVAVQVCRDVEQAIDAFEYAEVDFSFVFVLQHTREIPQAPIYQKSERLFVISFAISRPFDRSLPRDIRWIEDYLSPVVLTPGVLLSLINYIEQQLPTIEGMTEGERQRILDALRKLQDFLAVMLFNEGSFEGLAPKVISRGEQALREALFAIFRAMYPDYSTLITTMQWENTMSTYASALESLSILQRRGLEPLIEAKPNLVSRFGYRNHAGFQSQAKQFPHLLAVSNWGGAEGEVLFTRHPGEDYLLNSIVLSHESAESTLVAEGRRVGYIEDEIQHLLHFLTLRGHIQQNPETNRYQPAKTLSRAELLSLGHEILEETELVRSILSNKEIDDARKRVNLIVDELKANPDAAYDEIQLRLAQAQQTIRRSRNDLKQHMQSTLTRMRQHLYDLDQKLQNPLPTSDTGLAIDTHMNGVQRTLIKGHGSLIQRLSDITEQMGKMYDQIVRSKFDDLGQEQFSHIVGAYHEICAEAEASNAAANAAMAQIELHHDWIGLAERIRRQQDYLDVVAQITDASHLHDMLAQFIDEIGRKFATEGLLAYREIYDEYRPKVETLAEEITAAAKLAELARSTHPQTQPNQATEISGDTAPLDSALHQRLLDILPDGNVTTLNELLSQSRMSEAQFLSELLTLERSGFITTTIKRSNT